MTLGRPPNQPQEPPTENEDAPMEDAGQLPLEGTGEDVAMTVPMSSTETPAGQPTRRTGGYDFSLTPEQNAAIAGGSALEVASDPE